MHQARGLVDELIVRPASAVIGAIRDGACRHASHCNGAVERAIVPVARRVGRSRARGFIEFVVGHRPLTQNEGVVHTRACMGVVLGLYLRSAELVIEESNFTHVTCERIGGVVRLGCSQTPSAGDIRHHITGRSRHLGERLLDSVEP